MASYRVTMVIGAMRAGATPAAVLPAAKAACTAIANLEAADIAVVAGQARITIRYTETDGDRARQIGAAIAEHTNRIAQVLRYRITKRIKSRWVAI